MGNNSLVKPLNFQALPENKKENFITATYVGAVFILLAIIYFTNSLIANLANFFSTLTLAEIPGAGFGLPAPAVPSAHLALYLAAFQFTLGVGIIEIMMLAIRIFLHSPVDKKAETVGNLVFWLGTSFLVVTYLVNITIMTEWFVFWTGVIVIGGLSLITRAFVLIATKR